MDNALVICVISWLIAGIFAQAVKHKLLDWPRFRASFVAYRIVPEGLVTVVGRGLTVVELVLVCGLIFLQPAALWLAAGVLSVYASGIAVNVLRGRQQIDCGCGDEPTPVSWLLVLRNITLVVMAIYASILAAASFELSVLSALIALGLMVIAFVLYSAIEQLLANRGRHQRLWLGVS